MPIWNKSFLPSYCKICLIIYIKTSFSFFNLNAKHLHLSNAPSHRDKMFHSYRDHWHMYSPASVCHDEISKIEINLLNKNHTDLKVKSGFSNMKCYPPHVPTLKWKILLILSPHLLPLSPATWNHWPSHANVAGNVLPELWTRM